MGSLNLGDTLVIYASFSCFLMGAKELIVIDMRSKLLARSGQLLHCFN